MRRICLIILAILTAVIASSCTIGKADYFDDSEYYDNMELNNRGIYIKNPADFCRIAERFENENSFKPYDGFEEAMLDLDSISGIGGFHECPSILGKRLIEIKEKKFKFPILPAEKMSEYGVSLYCLTRKLCYITLIPKDTEIMYSFTYCLDDDNGAEKNAEEFEKYRQIGNITIDNSAIEYNGKMEYNGKTIDILGKKVDVVTLTNNKGSISYSTDTYYVDGIPVNTWCVRYGAAVNHSGNAELDEIDFSQFEWLSLEELAKRNDEYDTWYETWGETHPFEKNFHNLEYRKYLESK